MSKPIIVFVPGFWEGPTVYDHVASKLKEAGYVTITASLASTGSLPPNVRTYSDDIRAVKDKIEEAVDQDRTVILVMHSAGGFTGSHAAKGLSRLARSQSGKRGGIVNMVFLAGGIFPEGRKHESQLPCFDYQGERLYCKEPRSLLLHDISDAEAEQWLERFTFQPAAGCEAEAISYCGWRDIPSVYLICDEDRILPAPLQQQMADLAGSQVEHSTAGHLCMLSQPDQVVDVIKRAAEPKV